MERLAYSRPSDKIEAEDLAFILSPGGDGAGARVARPAAGRRDATRSRSSTSRGTSTAPRGNMSDAAEKLGLHRSNLYRKMRQLGMDAGEP